MKRGDLYRVKKPTKQDPKRFRVFVVVSRNSIFDTNFSTVVCAPVYSNYHGIATQVLVGVDEGLKHESSIYCDDLISLPKTILTKFYWFAFRTKIKGIKPSPENRA
jgi:mRNA interferase MazF